MPPQEPVPPTVGGCFTSLPSPRPRPRPPLILPCLQQAGEVLRCRLHGLLVACHPVIRLYQRSQLGSQGKQRLLLHSCIVRGPAGREGQRHCSVNAARRAARRAARASSASCSTAAPHAWPGGLLDEVVMAADNPLWQMACPFNHHLTATEIRT